MSQLDILVPFSLPPEEMSADLLRELKAPALAGLLARATPGRNPSAGERLDPFAPALPHEAWLAHQFGFGTSLAAENSPPIAPDFMLSLGLARETGNWFVLQPVHFFIARDHLVLTDPRQLELAEDESRALFEVARMLFEEDDKTLLFGNAGTWFVHADSWSQLRTSTPDAACGHNIDIWMPKGEGERSWRKIQNEVQMHWFTHPVNAEREAKGQKPVNSIWIWGGASPATGHARSAYSAVFGLSGWASALAQHASKTAAHASAGEVIAARPERGLVLLDELIEPALANDWSRWLGTFQQLEKDWFVPQLEALQSGKIDRVSLILTHNSRLSTFTASRLSLRKFWIKPSLARLCP
ncbi:hypothetical protein [Noviherbaspirillum massiliense]|uniref:hypothetical protein n=1 Tax=Noviherbaspirillum massiliense TaxID=1465823 RepID=UPI0004784F7B|nr:hypothetical protein [Noviherbaspirillum massiliense]